MSDFKAKCTKFNFGWGSAPDHAFHIFTMGESGDFKFGTQLDHSPQPIDDNPSLKGAWLWSSDLF